MGGGRHSTARRTLLLAVITPLVVSALPARTQSQPPEPLWTDPAPTIMATPSEGMPSAPPLAPIVPPQTPPPAGEPLPPPPTDLTLPPSEPAPTEHAHRDTTGGPMGMGGMMGGAMGGGGAPNSYRGFWMPDTSVAGQNTRWGLVGQDLSFMVPVWMSPPDMLALNFRVGQRHIETGAIQPDTQEPYPHDLWNLSAGMFYMRKLDNGWSAGGMLNVGSASDQPFHSIREVNVTTAAFLRMPSGERNAWSFALIYAPMSEIAFPIPGVAYLYNPSDDFRANIGIPLSVFYRPVENWTIDCSYMPIRNIHAKLAYRLAEGYNLFGRYDWNNEGYYLVDRTNWNDRFFIFDQRLSAGLEYKLTKSFGGEFVAGYLFDRSTFEGQMMGSREYNVVGLGAGPYLSATAGLRF